MNRKIQNQLFAKYTFYAELRVKKKSFYQFNFYQEIFCFQHISHSLSIYSFSILFYSQILNSDKIVIFFILVGAAYNIDIYQDCIKIIL